MAVNSPFAKITLLKKPANWKHLTLANLRISPSLSFWDFCRFLGDFPFPLGIFLICSCPLSPPAKSTSWRTFSDILYFFFCFVAGEREEEFEANKGGVTFY